MNCSAAALVANFCPPSFPTLNQYALPHCKYVCVLHCPAMVGIGNTCWFRQSGLKSCREEKSPALFCPSFLVPGKFKGTGHKYFNGTYNPGYVIYQRVLKTIWMRLTKLSSVL